MSCMISATVEYVPSAMGCSVGVKCIVVHRYKKLLPCYNTSVFVNAKISNRGHRILHVQAINFLPSGVYAVVCNVWLKRCKAVAHAVPRVCRAFHHPTIKIIITIIQEDMKCAVACLCYFIVVHILKPHLLLQEYDIKQKHLSPIHAPWCGT